MEDIISDYCHETSITRYPTLIRVSRFAITLLTREAAYAIILIHVVFGHGVLKRYGMVVKGKVCHGIMQKS